MSDSPFEEYELPNGLWVLRCKDHETREVYRKDQLERTKRIHLQFFHRQLDLATGEWITIIPGGGQ